IGVIALLISMLMPALQGARERARTITCQSQLRQIGIALTNYATMEKNWLPRWSRWHVYNGEGHPEDEPGLGWTEQLERYLTKPDATLYNCPSFPEEFRINYFLGVRYTAVQVPRRHSMKISEIRHSSEFVLGG